MHFLYMFAFTLFFPFVFVHSLSPCAFNLKAVKEHLGTGWFENWAEAVCEHCRYDAMLSCGGVNEQ